MTILRGASPGDAVVRILRSAAQDSRLSLRARGALLLCMSRPKDWRTDAEQISREAAEGERAVLTCLKELARYGYLRRERVRLPNGQITTEWVITDDPRLIATGPQKPRAGKPRAGAPRAGQPRGGSPRARSPRADAPRAENLRPLEGGETEEETPPPPTPTAQHARVDAVRSLVEVVGEALPETTKTPQRGVLLTECARLLDDGWTPDELRDAVGRHDWSGAGAGAVVAYLRGLTTADRTSASRRSPVERPAWCGACDEPSRLLLDDQGRPRRGQHCPECHPKTARRTT